MSRPALVPRLYLTNDSYPELREVPLGWARTRTWWRAIRRATRHGDFWRFVAVQAALLVALNGMAAAIVVAGGLGQTATSVRVGFAFAAAMVFCYLQISWGGDMMRRHLRAVSTTARFACPQCGHSLYGHLQAGSGPVRCPECGLTVDRATFQAPYPIPPACRAFPPRRRV